MALYCDLPVYKTTYNLLPAIFRFTKDFGKEYKYTVGESLKKETIELLTLIYRANIKRDKQAVLQEAGERIEVIRLFIRLMKDMQQISVKQFVQINKVVANLQKSTLKTATKPYAGRWRTIRFALLLQCAVLNSVQALCARLRDQKYARLVFKKF